MGVVENNVFGGWWLGESVEGKGYRVEGRRARVCLFMFSLPRVPAVHIQFQAGTGDGRLLHAVSREGVFFFSISSDCFFLFLLLYMFHVIKLERLSRRSVILVLVL